MHLGRTELSNIPSYRVTREPFDVTPKLKVREGDPDLAALGTYCSFNRGETKGVVTGW